MKYLIVYKRKSIERGTNEKGLKDITGKGMWKQEKDIRIKWKKKVEPKKKNEYKGKVLSEKWIKSKISKRKKEENIFL